MLVNKNLYLLGLRGDSIRTIKKLRLLSGMTQREVAKVLNVAQSAVSQWENGKSRPQRKYRRVLAAIYNCGEDDIVSMCDEKTEGE